VSPIVEAAFEAVIDNVYLLGRCVHRMALGEAAKEPERDSIVIQAVEYVLEELGDSNMESTLNSIEDLTQRYAIPGA
jgi:hypothetical protein